ncbi:unnamed protein product [Ilex paraguariensis]|uniref:Reticulon-like protein n=1 Tax=Ilex paraguariensis TaxID=185542 RepID=A0ABC8R091_9AQUA
MPTFETDSEDERAPVEKLFGRERPIHDVLGGGKVADVLLWRDKRVSATLLTGISVIWFLFEVVEYNMVTLLCHIFITTMLLIFIWSAGADIFKWTPPDIPNTILRESTFKEAVSTFHAKLNEFLSKFLYIACGNDPKNFFLAIISFSILSMIGNYISSLNLLFFGLLCMETLPFLYERYEEEVDYLAGRVTRRVRKVYKKVDTKVLEKIPRGPVKEKKSKKF